VAGTAFGNNTAVNKHHDVDKAMIAKRPLEPGKVTVWEDLLVVTEAERAD
jgi:hypothetical protein